jgi:undecaprenyl-diphosphatase
VNTVDSSIFRWINDLAGRATWANGLVRFYAKAGIVVFAVLLLVAFLEARRRHDSRGVAISVWAGGAALAALMLAQLIGRAVDRARPYDVLDNVHLLAARSTDFSFPSDHATVAGAVAAGLLLLADRRWGIIAATGAVLMALARIYIGVHYPSDVAAGLALGAGVALVGNYLAVPLLTGVVDRLAATPLRRLVTSTS